MNSSRFLKKLFTLGLSASTAVFASSYVLNLDSLQDDSASAPEALVTGTGSAFGSSITTPFTLDYAGTMYVDKTTGYLWGAGGGNYGMGVNTVDYITKFTALYKNGSIVDNSASNPTKANETGYFTNPLDYAYGGWAGAVIDEDGAVWSSGLNSYGQLGNGGNYNHTDSSDRRFQTYFGTTNITSGAVKVAVGSSYIVVQMDDGSVMAAGTKAYVGLGSGSQTTFIETISRFTTTEKRGIVDMSISSSASYILFGDGDLWVANSTSNGEWTTLGSNIKMFDIDPRANYIYAVTTANVIMYAYTTDTSFTEMATQPTEEVMQIRGSGLSTSYNAWGYLTTSGNLYLSSTAVSPGNTATAEATKRVSDVAYFDLGCNSNTTLSVSYAYLTNDGTLTMWGSNSCGQLANGNTTDLAYANRITKNIGLTNETVPDINGGIVNTPPYAPKKQPSEAIIYF